MKMRQKMLAEKAEKSQKSHLYTDELDDSGIVYKNLTLVLGWDRKNLSGGSPFGITRLPE